ncbi:hypothetical protein I3842_16G110700 [Carya illinoinensis]|uniref:Uncharacterized protein n=1 Tax=Carya illinoinensis TaxID=32201 RepID=A0A922A8H4_CARIL|nr:hypothetical protein I3842_16G110700 [Carya illinoinensis]
MDDQITKAKEQTLNRKDILDKVEKSRYATKEEKWLEEYERLQSWMCYSTSGFSTRDQLKSYLLCVML